MITGSMADAFVSLGLAPPARERTLSIVGLSLLDAMKALVPEADPGLHQKLGEAYKQAFWANWASGTHSEDLFPELATYKLRERQDVILGIATGKSRRGVDHLIAHHGFDGWFDTIQTSSH